MPQPPHDQPSQVDPVEGEVSVRGPGSTSLSFTPGAARRTAGRLTAAADRADAGHVEAIDPNSPAAVDRWAQRLGVTPQAVHDAIEAVGPDSEGVAAHVASRKAP